MALTELPTLCTSFWAFIGGTANVTGGYSSGSANVSGGVIKDLVNITDYAKVYGNVTLKDSATVKEWATITGNATVYGNATVAGNSTISGLAKIGGNSTILGVTTVRGDSNVTDSRVNNSTIVDSFVDPSVLYNAKFTNVQFINSKVYNSELLSGTAITNANVTNNYLYSGTLTYGGVTYTAPISLDKIYSAGVKTHSLTVSGQAFNLRTLSNSSIHSLALNVSTKKLSFTIEGATGVSGYCNITVLRTLLGGPYVVYLDGAKISSTTVENSTHAFVYFTYTHSVHIAEVKGRP